MSDPTPQQIHERCLEIQKGWTPKQRIARRIVKIPGYPLRPPIGIPVVKATDIAGRPIDISEEMVNWQFLTDAEAAYPRLRFSSSENCGEDELENEDEECVEYRYVKVNFGQ